MRIIDRYIARSVVATFVIAVFVFCLLYVLIDSASNLDEFIDRQVPFSVITEYYMNFLPVVVKQTGPIAFLIAALLTFAMLNTNNELIALRAGGLGFFKLARPVLILALLCCAGFFYLNERYLPESEKRAREIKEENLTLKEDRQKASRLQNLSFYGLKNRLFFISSFDPETETLQGITIIGFDEQQNIREKIVSFEGTWTGIAWKFKQCHITEFGNSPTDGPAKIKVYEEKLMDIKETPADFLRQRTHVNYMNIKQLHEYIERFENSGAASVVNSLKVNFHGKMAAPFSSLAIVLLGLPLVMVSGRRQAQNFTALGIALIVGLLYYVADSVSLALGQGGALPPIIAAWLAPCLAFLIALYNIQSAY